MLGNKIWGKYMKIDINEIFTFYELRIKSHVEAVNYFASLLGYHFPEHDSDKVTEQIRTGYAYIFYKTYHKNFHVTKVTNLCGPTKKNVICYNGFFLGNIHRINIINQIFF